MFVCYSLLFAVTRSSISLSGSPPEKLISSYEIGLGESNLMQ